MDWVHQVQEQLATASAGVLQHYLELHPPYAADRDLSAVGLEYERRTLLADRERLASFDPRLLEWPSGGFARARIDDLEVLEYAALLTAVDGALFELDRRVPWRDPDVYLRAHELRTKLTAPRFEQHPEWVVTAALAHFEAARENLDDALARPLVERALRRIAADLELIEELRASARPPSHEALATLAAVLRDFETLLRERLPAAHQDFALGSEGFAELLERTQGVRVDLRELERVAQAQLEHHRALLTKAALQVDPEASLTKLVAEVEHLPGPELIAVCDGVRSELLEALDNPRNTEGVLLLLDELEAGPSEHPKAQLARAHRALIHDVRLVVALGLHTRGMSLDAATELFEREALLSPSAARAAALDVAAEPELAISAISKLAWAELREDFLTRETGWSELPKEELLDKALRCLPGAPLGGLRAMMIGEDGALFRIAIVPSERRQSPGASSSSSRRSWSARR